MKFSTAPAITFIVALFLAWPATSYGQASGESNTGVSAPSPAGDPQLECAEYVPPEERKDPKRLALRGVACFEKGDYLTAMRHYRKAREVSDANLLNAAIGRTFQELGYPFIARRYYRDYLGGQIDDSAGRQRIEERLAAVEQDLKENGATVELTSTPPGAEVYVMVEGKHRESLGRTPITVQMLPGDHRFVVERDGYLAQEHDVQLASGETRPVETKLVDADAAFGVSGRTLRRAGIITMAAGTPLIATGASLWIVGRQKKTDGERLRQPARDEQITQGSRLQQWGLVSGILGVTALTTGFVLWWSGRHVEEAPSPGDQAEGEESTQIRVAPVISPFALGLRATF